MSKAFTDEDAPPPDDTPALPPRDRRQPITPAGLARLRGELAALRGAGAAPSEPGGRRARLLAHVLEWVDVVEPSAPGGRAAFGALVTVEDADGAQATYELVGPDEVDVAAGRISVASPVGRALLGTRAGDRAVLPRPRGAVEVTVTSVSCPPG